MKLRAIIIEDNISFSWDYEMILEKLQVEVIGVYKSWKDVLPIIKRQLPDFMIVDLFLENNEKGLDFIKQLKDFFIPTIICTGYPEEEYLQEALDYNVHAFLTKPVDKSALSYQVQRIRKLKESNKESDGTLTIKVKHNILKIPYDEISKILIEGNYASIYLISGKRYVLKLSLKRLQETLDSSRFIRCHRSALVNLSHIERLDLKESKVVLKGEDHIELGKKFRKSVKDSFS